MPATSLMQPDTAPQTPIDGGGQGRARATLVVLNEPSTTPLTAEGLSSVGVPDCGVWRWSHSAADMFADSASG